MPSYRDFRPSVRFQQTLALSPDGDTVAYVDDASGQFNLSTMPVSGGVPTRVTGYTDNTVRRVAWHPDGTSLVFTADTNGDERYQVYRVASTGTDPERLTTQPDAQFALATGDPFAPGGRLLAYTGNDRSPADQDVLVHDLETGEVRRVYSGGGRVYAGHWSPDGTRLTAAHWIEGNSDHVVYLVRADGSPAVRLSPEGVTATYWLGPWLPDGSGFLVHSDAGREFTGLAVMDATTGDLTWLDTPDWDVDVVTLSADGKVLVWLVDVDGSVQLRARELSTGREIPVPALPMGVAEVLALSPDGSRAVTLLSTPARPWNLTAVDLGRGGEGGLRRLTDARPIAADASRFVEPVPVRYPSRDGTPIPALLYRPADVSEPTGVVLSIHGGPVSQERPEYARDGLYQYLLQRGVAVLAPNVRGSWGYGKSYTLRIYRDWGGVDLDDFAGAADWLRTQDWVDPARIGLFGGSYGGFAVLSCLARLPELDWAAGVDLYGISNLVTLANASPPTWRSLIAKVIGDPDADRDFLLSRPPVTYADRIRAPLFIIQGAVDPRVPQGESDQIVARLRARGVEVRYDVYPDEGHGFTKSENQLRAYSDAAEFLIAHLTG